MLKLELTKYMLLKCFGFDRYTNFENYCICRIHFEESLGL